MAIVRSKKSHSFVSSSRCSSQFSSYSYTMSQFCPCSCQTVSCSAPRHRWCRRIQGEQLLVVEVAHGDTSHHPHAVVFGHECRLACARIQVRELQEGSRGTVESRHGCCALQRRGCSAWLTCLVEAMGLLCVPELSWVSLERRRGEFEKASGVLGARSIVTHGDRVY